MNNWQYRHKKRVSRLEKDEFVVLTQDEVFFMHDMIIACKYWSPINKPVSVSYIRSHKRIAAYDSITKDGRHLFQTYEKFDVSIFVVYFKEMWRRFGRVAVIQAGLRNIAPRSSGIFFVRIKMSRSSTSQKNHRISTQ